MGVTDIAVSPVNENIIYIATGNSKGGGSLQPFGRAATDWGLPIALMGGNPGIPILISGACWVLLLPMDG